MRHRFSVALLAFGVIAGYASGIASLCHHRAHRAAFERHVAQVCLDAAKGKPLPSYDGNGD